MTKKYLIDETDTFSHQDHHIFNMKEAKEVEVLDDDTKIDYVYYEFVESKAEFLSDYLKANNLIIVKIKE